MFVLPTRMVGVLRLGLSVHVTEIIPILVVIQTSRKEVHKYESICRELLKPKHV